MTHREHASALQLVTAHCRGTMDDIDWSGLARPGQTLAFYGDEGTHQRLRPVGRAGLAPDAAALVENGTCPNSGCWSRTSRLPEAARTGSVAGDTVRRRGPAVPPSCTGSAPPLEA